MQILIQLYPCDFSFDVEKRLSQWHYELHFAFQFAEALAEQSSLYSDADSLVPLDLVSCESELQLG